MKILFINIHFSNIAEGVKYNSQSKSILYESKKDVYNIYMYIEQQLIRLYNNVEIFECDCYLYPL